MQYQDYLSIAKSTEIAQKILSAVFWLKERASPSYVLLNLKGKTNPATLKLKHHTTTTFGVLARYSDEEIKYWIDQVALQFELIKLTSGNCLTITSRGTGFLKKRQQLRLKACKPKSVTPDGTKIYIKKTKKYVYTQPILITSRSGGGYKLPRERSGYKMRVRKPDNRFRFDI